MNQGQTLRLRIKGTGLTVQEAAEKLGVSRQTLHTYFGKASLDKEFLQIVKRSLGLDLATPTGVLRTPYAQHEEEPAQVQEPYVPFKRGGKQSAAFLNTSDYMVMEVPLVNKFAYAGYLSGYGDNVYIKSLPKYAFMVDKEYKGTYLAFEVKGDSMDNGTREGYAEGDIILGREVPQIHWANKLHITKWDFVIVTKTEGIVLKKIIEHNTATGQLTLHSLNELYPDIKMNLRDVAQIFNVVQVSIKK